MSGHAQRQDRAGLPAGEVGRIYDAISDTYDHQHVDAKSLSENRYVTRYLEGFLRPGDRVLDLGCGTGLLLDLLPLPASGYAGCDISPGMLEQARRKHPHHRFVEGNIEGPLPELADGSFTAAVSLFGSSSYCDLERVRATLWRLLEPGGRYFLMLCGPRYPTRGSYVTKHTNLLRPQPAERVRQVFPGADVWGLSCAVDAIPAGAPSWLVESVQRLETAAFGRTFRDAFYFLNVTGTR